MKKQLSYHKQLFKSGNISFEGWYYKGLAIGLWKDYWYNNGGRNYIDTNKEGNSHGIKIEFNYE